MKNNKKRVKKGEKYWIVLVWWSHVYVDEAVDLHCISDNDNWNQGNYFNTKEEAEAMAHRLRAVLNGADVIETPSEEEFETVVQDSTHEITCGGHDRMYAADGQGKILDNITYEEVADIIRNIVEQLKSKIIK